MKLNLPTRAYIKINYNVYSDMSENWLYESIYIERQVMQQKPWYRQLWGYSHFSLGTFAHVDTEEIRFDKHASKFGNYVQTQQKATRRHSRVDGKCHPCVAES